MMKPASVFAAIAVALVPQLAHADFPNGETITFDMLRIQDENGSYYEPDVDQLREYTNLAHCVCGKAGQGKEQKIQYRISISADSNTDKPGEFWVGESCDSEELRDEKCRRLVDPSIGNVDDLYPGGDEFEFSTFDVLVGKDPMADCPAIEVTKNLYLLVDTGGESDYEYKLPQPFGTDTALGVEGIDTKPPPLPTKFKGESAENAIRLSWTAPTTQSDIYGYQALCVKDGTATADVDEPPPMRYTRAVDLCGLDTTTIVLTETPLTSTGGPAAFPEEARALDPTFLCGEVLSSTADSMLITGLENDVPYSIILVTVDKSGNAVAAQFTTTVTPQPAFDFWEDLHNRGSNVEGGFCLAGSQTPGGTAGPLALALGWLLVRRRRRDARMLARLAPIAALAFIVFGDTRVASAQGTTPYWEEQQEEDARLADEDVVRWHVGLRLGPYTPDIDKQFGMDPGPYSEMFGGYQVLPMLDIDRIVWRGVGQLGFGGSIGYMQKTANAWATPIPGEDRMRSPGDENTFRLWPIVATAVYRFTWLDDNYGIPIVPYVRGGISYYIWWMRTNGKTSDACWDGTDTPDCDADKAVGATIGVQGSIGLAIRAERVDAAAASAMRAGGIEHAGFYGELQMAKVDGFGSEFKLSVGDTTWFAGVNFEF